MINYAHRGASEYAPENTLSAFYLGLLQGAPRLRGQKPRAARAKAHDKNNVMVLHPSNSNPGQMVLRPAPA